MVGKLIGTSRSRIKVGKLIGTTQSRIMVGKLIVLLKQELR